MDGQLKAVRQDIRSVKEEIVQTKQDLAAAKQAQNEEKERSLFELLLSLNNQLLSLQEKENILLRSQAPSKPCLQCLQFAPEKGVMFAVRPVGNTRISHLGRVNAFSQLELILRRTRPSLHLHK